MRALQSRDVLKVQPLLDQGADPNLRSGGDLTPLLAGIGTGNLPVVRCLLDHGANPNLKNDQGLTPLQAAIQAAIGTQVDAQDVQIVRLLLDRGATVNEPGQSVLNFAAQCGDTPLVQFLLSHGADLHQRDDLFGGTPLATAVVCDHAAIVSLLLRQGAITDINRGDAEAKTPLMRASEQGTPLIAQILLAHGANANAVSVKGPDITSRVGLYKGWTALMLAARGDHKNVARLLLAAGAHINIVAADGNTALSWAALKGHPNMVAWLLAHGARSRIRNIAGHTPLALAQELKDWQISQDSYHQIPGGLPDYDKTIRLLQHASQ